MSQKEREKAVGACLRSERKDFYVEKKQLFLIFQIVKITKYEIFDLVFDDSMDKIEENDLIFTPKFVVGDQQISIYALNDKQKVDVVTCLDFLNGLQEKFVNQNSWYPFCFNYFSDNNDIRVYRFCKNEDEKRLYEHFCNLAISQLKKMKFKK